MSALRLFSRNPERPTLRQRLAALRGGAARPAVSATAPASNPLPLPAPGSDEAVAAFEAACREHTRLTPLSDAEYAALRIGDTHTLWTTEWIKALRRGDFSRFSLREFEVARSKTPSELSDLLVLTTRRDHQFAVAEQRTNIKTLYALAYPDGEDPEPLPDPEGDYAHVVIAEHRAAYAAWKPLGDAWNETTTDHDDFEAAQAEPYRIQAEAFGELIDTRASTVAGLRALAAYLPGAVFDANCVEVEEDARRALRSVCEGVLALVPSETEDADLLALGRDLDAARGPVRRSLPPGNTIAAGLCFSAMSLLELAWVHEGIMVVKDAARAISCQPRSRTDAPHPAPDLNALGLLMEWLGEALGHVSDEALDELRGRTPADGFERDRRLQALAEATVSDGDPEAIRAFTRELLETVET